MIVNCSFIGNILNGNGNLNINNQIVFVMKTQFISNFALKGAAIYSNSCNKTLIIKIN